MNTQIERQALEVFRRLLDTADSRQGDVDSELASLPPEVAERVRALLAGLDSDSAALYGALQSPTTAMPAELGGFILQDELGRGGMGVVAAAERRQGDVVIKAAVKWVPASELDETRRARFRFEQQVIARLSHPGIARLIDAGETAAGDLWYAMERIHGERIDDYCARNRLSIEQRLRLVLELADALEYAHRHLVLHRDIKPGNVLVTEDGRAKLIDFGIAKALSDDAPDLTVEQAPMTLRYASPEQLRREAMSTRSDLWQLAALAYELLSGSAARTSLLDTAVAPASTSALRAKPEHLESLGLSAQQAAADLRGDIDAVLAKALRDRPEDRYPTVDAFAADLRATIAGLPVLARRGERWYRATRFLRRHRAAALLGAVVLVLAVGLAWSTIRSAQHEAESAQQTVKVLSDVLFAPANDESEGDALTMTAASLLERARVRILDQTELDIRQRFVLSGQLARRAMDLSAHRTAQSAAREHLRLAEELHGNEGLDVAFAMDLVAESIIKSRDRQSAASALAMLDRSAGLYERGGALQSMGYLGHLVTRAWLESLAEEFDRAVETFGRAAELSGSISSASIGTHERHLAQYSMFLRNAGRWDEAEQVVDRAMVVAAASGDRLPWADRAAIEGEACIVHSNQATVNSIEICQRRVDSLERADALESGSGAAALLGLAIAQSNRGALVDALATIERSEAASIAHEGRNQQSTNMRHIQLARARILAKMLRWDEAIAAYRESIRLFIARDGEASARIGRTRVELIETLLQAGRPAEAREVVEAGVAIDEADEKSMQRWRAAQEALRLAEG